MPKRIFQLQLPLAILCVFALLRPSLIWAIANDGYTGNSIGGRNSVAVVDAPGGTKVNTLLGNLILARTGLRIPGRGLPMELLLTYNSNQNGIASPFGFGWTFHYGIRCLLSASRNVVVEWADGRSDLFQYRNGLYKPFNESVFASLALVGGMLQLTTKEQILYFFDTSRGQLQKIQDPNGNALTFTNSNGRLTAINDASGRSLLLSYDANGRVTQITDPNVSPARTLQYAYDAGGNQVQYTDPLGNVTSYSYDGSHRLIRSNDPLGITTITYGPPNFTIASVSRSSPANALVSTRSFSYNTANLTTTVTDQGGNTTYQYDSRLRLSRVTDALGHAETHTYDGQGNVASVTDPNGNTTRYAYDTKGNILSVTDGLSHTMTYGYDPVFSRVTSTTDPLGNTASYTYDVHGNLTTARDALGNVTRYSYDAVGQLVSRQNARGFTTQFTYDALGNRTGVTDPLNRTLTFGYDPAGNLASRTDANRNTTNYTYDSANRLIRTVYPDSTQAQFTYDAQNKMLTAVDPNTSQSMVYDAAGRMTSVTDQRLLKSMSFQYDSVGNRTQAIDPEGVAITYTYDAANRPIAISRQGQQTSYSYDSAGRMTGKSLPNGVTVSYTNDAANRVTSVVNRKSDNSVVSSFTYQYDNAARRTRLTLAGGDRIDYTYDADDQLIRELRAGAASYDHRFSYDAGGNRVQLNADGTVTNSVYDGADELTQETNGAGSTAYQYDANGNRVQKNSGANTATYSYDFNDQLTGFVSGSAAATYAIDALGRRAAKSAGGTTTRFFFDGQDAVAEYDGAGGLQAQNLFAPGVDNNLARFAGGSSLYYLHDALNSVRNVVDSGQTVQNGYDYDAWGNAISKTENVANRYTFTGRESDSESGLYHYRLRMYDPLNGRFSQVDPIDLNLGRSAYAYVNNNPMNMVDPYGAIGWLAAIAIALVVVFVVVVVVKIVKLVVQWAYNSVKAIPPNWTAQVKPPYKPKTYNSEDDDDYGSPGSKKVVAVANGSNGAGCTGLDGGYAQGSTAV